ncbi:hypothetical protein [Legionella sp. WA2022007384]
MMSLGNMTIAYLLWGVLFSVIGLIYGKRQKNVPLLSIGVVLMLYPMFISNTYILVLVGAILVIIPYFL